jgi:hypothetical protein
MKKMTFLAFAMLFALCGSSLHAQTDVTAQYLTNPSFDEAPIAFEGPGATANPSAVQYATSGYGSRIYVPTGWSLVVPSSTTGNAQYTRLATGLFNVDYTSVPDAFNGVEFPTSDRTGAFLAMSGGYATTPLIVQNVTLPAGQYQLQYDVYDKNSGKTVVNYFGFVPNSGDAIYGTETAFTTSWATYVVNFTLTTVTSGKISVGIKGGSTSGSGSNAQLAVDNIKLFFTGNASQAIAPLKAELTALRDSTDMPAGYDLTAVNALLATTPTEENTMQLISDLTAAISTLQNVIAFSNSLKTSILNTQALADTIAVTEVKTKLLTEISAANAVITTATTSEGLQTAKTFIDALRTFAENIQSAKKLYDTTTEGNAIGQYTATVRAEFLTAINTAVSAFVGATTAAAANTANTDLNSAKTAYQNVVNIPSFVPLANKAYVVRHASDFVLTQTATVAKIQTFADAGTQKFRFIQVTGTSGTYNIVSMDDNKLLAREGSWATQWLANNADNAALANAQFQFVFRTGDFYAIKNLGSNSYLGTDAISNDSEIYSNKGGTDAAKHYWKFEEQEGDLGMLTSVLENAIAAAQALADTIAVSEVKTKLQTEIATATALLTSATLQAQIDDAALYLTVLRTFAENIQANKKLYDTTVEGSAGGQYPATARAEFLVAINTAISAFAAVETPEAANIANSALNTANYLYLAAYINPFSDFTFNLKHYNSDFYVSKAKTNAFTNAHIQALDTATYSQVFVFEKILGVVNGVRMKTLDGYYLDHSGYTSSWTTTPGAGSDMVVEQDASGFIKLKFTSSNSYFGTDANSDGSSIFTDKNGTSNNHRWIIEVTDPRVKLEKLLDEANMQVSTAVAGTETGNYPQTAINTFNAAISLAKAVYDNQTATDDELIAAAQNLKTAMDVFVSQQIVFSTFYVGKDLNVIHSSGFLFSKAGDGAPTIQTQNAANFSQTFRFESVIGQVDVVALKSADGKYLAYLSGYSPTWIDSIDASTQLKISLSNDNYLLIKFVNKNYLGTDTNADSSTVYADKSGNDIRHKWLVQEPGLPIKIRLGGVLATANKLLQVTQTGTAEFAFPQAAYSALTSARNTAQSVYDDAAATQSNIDAQVLALTDAIELYYTRQILPAFNPAANKQYIISNKQYAGYLKSNGARAIVDATPPIEGWEFTQVRDSVWILKMGNLALAQSLNMVEFNTTSSDRQWYVHYDGPKENDVYVRDPDDAKNYFSFTSNATFNNALQQTTSGNGLQIAASHSHTDQSQWFAITEIGAPITDGLAAMIEQAQTTFAAATVGTTYGNYPQAAKDSLQNAITIAQAILADVANLNQLQINAATDALRESLTWFNNQKIVWEPEEGMMYYIGNRDNANYLSIDTISAGTAKGFKLDSIPLINQVWQFIPVNGKKGFYHIINGRNAIGASGGTSIFVQNYDAVTASEIEIQYANTTSGVEYFWLVTTNTYPRIHIDSDGNVSSDRYSNNNYQLKLVSAGALRSEIYFAMQLLQSATVGNGLTEYPQDAATALQAVIDASLALAQDNDGSNDDAQVTVLQAAEQTFRESQSGYGLNLSALEAAIATANELLENTTEIGSEAGKCPQSVINALIAAVATAKDATGMTNVQASIDNKVTALNAAIATFKTDLKASTGLTALLAEAKSEHAAAVEGTQPGQYREGAKAEYKTAIDAAQAIFDAEPVIQANLIAAYNALLDAQDVFAGEKMEELYTADLEAAIAAVEEFLEGKSESEFTDLRALLAQAKALLGAPTTQDDIDALTDALYEALDETGIEQVFANGVKVFAADGALHISGLTDQAQVGIFNMLGQMVLSAKTVGSDFIQPLEKGVYIVTVNSIHLKVSVR